MPAKQYVIREPSATAISTAGTTIDFLGVTGTVLASFLNVSATGSNTELDIQIYNVEPLSFNTILPALINHTSITGSNLPNGTPFSEIKSFTDQSGSIFGPVIKIQYTVSGSAPSVAFSHEIVTKGY